MNKLSYGAMLQELLELLKEAGMGDFSKLTEMAGQNFAKKVSQNVASNLPISHLRPKFVPRPPIMGPVQQAASHPMIAGAQKVVQNPIARQDLVQAHKAESQAHKALWNSSYQDVERPPSALDVQGKLSLIGRGADTKGIYDVAKSSLQQAQGVAKWNPPVAQASNISGVRTRPVVQPPVQLAQAG